MRWRKGGLCTEWAGAVVTQSRQVASPGVRQRPTQGGGVAYCEVRAVWSEEGVLTRAWPCVCQSPGVAGGVSWKGGLVRAVRSQPGEKTVPVCVPLAQVSDPQCSEEGLHRRVVPAGCQNPGGEEGGPGIHSGDFS